MATPQSTSGDVSQIPSILAKFGVPYDSFFDRYQTLWQTITSRNVPVPGKTDCSWFPEDIGSHLCARGILYYRNSVGDCGKPVVIGSSAAQKAFSILPNAVGEAAGISSLIAGATAGISVGLGVATAGIGLLLAPIMGIFAHHQQAVANEQSTICQVATAANQAIPQLDSLVISGQITAQQGIDGMRQLIDQLKSGLAPISGRGDSNHPCNAGCCYQAILECHADFAQTFYKDISPMGSLPAPGQVNTTSQASALQARIDNMIPPPGSPNYYASGIVPFPWTTVLLFAIAGLLLYKLAVKS